MYKIVETSASWDGRININAFPYGIEEIFFWKNNFSISNNRFIANHYIPPMRAYSDASSNGNAAHLHVHGTTKIASKNLSLIEQSKSSTWREIFAIEFALKAFQHLVQNQSVLWEH